MSKISESVKRLYADQLGEGSFGQEVAEETTFQHFLGFFKERWGAILSTLLFLIISITGIIYYNDFVLKETQAITDQAQTEVQMQRRKDLLINLTQTIVEYAQHERLMFKYMADQRSEMMGQDPDKFKDLLKSGPAGKAAAAPGDMGNIFSRLMALAESYPELKLSGNFQKLMDALIEIEDRIVQCRMKYNESCNVYNTRIRIYPQKLAAMLLGFTPLEYVDVDKDIRDFNRLHMQQLDKIELDLVSQKAKAAAKALKEKAEPPK
ncbi:MAG: LemA family protein [Planctomycetes bacterium]|nr:LemA family protein [Planctomycetota bacterium]